MVCINEEIPFEIPQTWEWCRFSNICECELGKALDAEKNTGEPKEYLTGINVYWNRIDFSQMRKMKMTDAEFEKFHLEKGDLIICEGGDAGRCAVWNSDKKIAFQKALHRARFYCKINPFFYMFLLMLYQDALILDQYITGTTIKHLTNVQLRKLFVPLPPIKEQQRILARLEELLPIVEHYGKLQENLEVLRCNIHILLRKSILQEAIQGRLVPQNPNDEPATVLLEKIREEKARLLKEGKLKKNDVIDSTIFRGDDNKYFEKKGKDTFCIDEEIPFEIPDTWAWVRLDDICEYIQRGKSPKYSPIKKYPVIAQKCNQWSGFSIEKAQFIVPETISSYGEERKLQDRDLLWNSTGLGTLGRMAIYYTKLNPYELAVADSHVTVIRAFKQFVCPEYLYAYFTSYTVQSVIEDKSDGSTKQKELATNTVKAYLVPLPPYEEQKHIVNRIDEIFLHLI